jgi:homoserine kinase
MAVTAQQMVDKLTTALQTQPAGVVSVTVDGQIVQFNRQQAIDELAFWEKRAAQQSGNRPRTASINLRGF